MSLLDKLTDSFPSPEKRDAQVADRVAKAVRLLRAKMYKLALITLDQLYREEPEKTVAELTPLLSRYSGEGNEESFLSIGLILLRHDLKNVELANRLGNAARKQGNYAQAENLYRHALKIQPDYRLAYYNLGACRAKAEIYDTQVRETLAQYFNFTHYLLPPAKKTKLSLNQALETLSQKKEAAQAKKLEKLNLERRIKEQALDLLALHAVDRKIKEAQAETTQPTTQELYDFILRQAQAEYKTNPLEAEGLLYNLTLHLIGQQAWELANQSLAALTRWKSQDSFLPMLKACVLSGLKEVSRAAKILVELLGKDPYNRYYNANLALVYKDQGSDLTYLKYAILTAFLLMKSEGIFDRQEIYQKAVDYFETGRPEAALPLFEIVVAEESNPEAHWRIAQIHLEKNRLPKAVETLKKLLDFASHRELAQKKLTEIQQQYSDKGSQAFGERKYKSAAGWYQKALEVKRDKEALQNLLRAYRVLKQESQAIALQLELEDLKRAEKEAARERQRQAYLRQGVMYFKRRNFYQAIEQFENAFRMKVDKQVFLYLTTLYKALRKNKELTDLLRRWQELLTYDDKLRAANKLAAQSRAASTNPSLTTQSLLAQLGPSTRAGK